MVYHACIFLFGYIVIRLVIRYDTYQNCIDTVKIQLFSHFGFDSQRKLDTTDTYMIHV